MTDIEAAQQDRAADLDRLADLDADQVDYLDRLAEVPDPLSDGIECDHDDRRADEGLPDGDT